jgi:hypothetical protein
MVTLGGFLLTPAIYLFIFPFPEGVARLFKWNYFKGGCGAMVAHQLPKLRVASSSLVARSKTLWLKPRSRCSAEQRLCVLS